MTSEGCLGRRASRWPGRSRGPKWWPLRFYGLVAKRPVLAPPENRQGHSATEASSFVLTERLLFRHFPQLDGLRGLAVLMVVVEHTLIFQYQRGSRWNLGQLGVLMFFVLSGFLITGLLCSEDRRFRAISLKDFYLRRVFRILPALALYLLTVSLLISVRLVTDTQWKSVLASALFVENDFGGGLSVGHLWSLSIEEQFYLFWPLLFLLVGRRRLLAPTLGLILGVWVYRAAAIAIAPYDYGSGIFEHRSDFRMESILVGCGLALLFDRRPMHPQKLAPLARFGAHPALLIPLLFVWSIYFERPPFLGVFLTIQTVLMVLLVFHLILFPDSFLGQLLRTRALRLLGLISYALYLWNLLFIGVSVPDWGFIRRMPFCLVASIGVAVLSYVLVERPALSFRRRLSIVR